MSEAARQVWPTVRSIPVSSVTDSKPPAHLRPIPPEQVAGSTGTGRDTTGGSATGVGTGRARPRGAGAHGNPAAALGFSGDGGQHGDPEYTMLHAQRVWDGTLATNRMDDLGVNTERQRVETKGVTVAVGLLVAGRPEDALTCVQSVIDHTHARILALDLGNIDGAGEVLDELAGRYPERIAVWHVAETTRADGGTVGWGECRTKLLRLDESEVHVLMETSLVLTGEALTPLVAAIVEGAVAAGWQAAESGEPGRVEALRCDLMAVRRAAALGAFPEDAERGPDADLKFSHALEGELVVPEGPLPVRRIGSERRDEQAIGG
ncbi:hypothetical protein [Nonomuraea sp. WAC 01424]|uniref:hypothetical protein n=1 Tax=Nonomuraea sp. WAC 01424 TaxID=2203200 RepID=UPI000F781645|nr:hypothetical protein [Nonomuraea sp. WAC 01424]